MISVILPSIRRHLINNCVQSILNATSKQSQHDLEIICICDYAPTHYIAALSPIITWLFNVERKGVVDANIKGYNAAQGDYVMTISDEAKLYPGSLDHLEAFCKKHDNNVLTSPAHIPYFPFFYYGKWFAPFPFAHRSVIEKVGGLFLPEYKCFYADPDLSLRAYENGVPVLECDNAMIHHPNDMACVAHQHNVKAYVEADRETFKKRWTHLGEFKDP